MTGGAMPEMPGPPDLRLADNGHARIIETGWDPVPRWLRYSGLPQVLQPPSAMDVYERLLMRTLANRGLERPPTTDDGQLMMPGAVNWTQEEIAARLGCSYRTIQRAVPVLEGHHLLTVLQRGHRVPGGPSKPSWGVVDLQLLEHIYVLTCGSIPKDVGGLCEWGRGDDDVRARLWQAATPIRIKRSLGADDLWTEPPIELLRLLCASPEHFQSILSQVVRTRELQAELVRLERLRERGGTPDVSQLQERLAGLTWRPAELSQAVENVVESVGKTHGGAGLQPDNLSGKPGLNRTNCP